jgi:hypothetical protein
VGKVDFAVDLSRIHQVNHFDILSRGRLVLCETQRRRIVTRDSQKQEFPRSS